jgi:NAD(P)-dependent dehydrogenase (short-subunit alcohol dehydrogenase family)
MGAYTLITGSTSGIGKALAIELSKTRNVLLLGRNEEKLSEVSLLCNKKNVVKYFVADLNLDRKDICRNLSCYIEGNGITIDSFVHCAGIFKICPMRAFPISRIDEIFNINVFSAIEIIKALLKKYNYQAIKNIIFISAESSLKGEIANSIYVSSKGAINSLTFSLAKELAPIRVNAILPGAVETPMTEQFIDSEEGKKQLEGYILGLGKSIDIVNAIKFLLSDDSRWITGQTICVDGGRSIL